MQSIISIRTGVLRKVSSKGEAPDSFHLTLHRTGEGNGCELEDI